MGNKSDLKTDRQVPREVGTNLSKAWGNVPYYESSARKRINVDEVFADIVRQCRALELEEGGSRSKEKRSKDSKGKGKCAVM